MQFQEKEIYAINMVDQNKVAEQHAAQYDARHENGVVYFTSAQDCFEFALIHMTNTIDIVTRAHWAKREADYRQRLAQPIEQIKRAMANAPTASSPMPRI